MLWREMRQTYLSNRVYPDTDALDQAVATAWLALSNTPQRLQRLTDFPWIRAARDQAFQRPDTS